ncbi:MAG: hypothetical protein ACK4RS_01160 [Thiothrix sp.]
MMRPVRVCLVVLGLIVTLTLGCDQRPTQSSNNTRSAATDATGVAVQETYLRALTFEEDTLDTRFGKLEITYSRAGMPPDTLSLAGKQVFRQEGFYLSLHYYLRAISVCW